MSEHFGPGAARLYGLAAQWLGWSPDTFWNATPSELASALGTGTAGADPIHRNEMEALMTRFPDRETNDG